MAAAPAPPTALDKALRAAGISTSLLRDVSRPEDAGIVDSPEPAGLALVSDTALVGANGRSAVSMQAPTVQYLTDDTKLVVPSGLIDAAPIRADSPEDFAIRCIDTIRFVGNYYAADMAGGQARCLSTLDTGLAAWLGPMELWYTRPNDGHIEVATRYGVVTANGAIDTDVGHGNNRMVIVSIKYGGGPDDIEYFMAPNDDPARDPNEAAHFFDNPDIIGQMSAYFSIACGLNYSIIDRQALLRANMRWNDTDCQDITNLTSERFRSKLEGYTLIQVAALNLTRVNSIPSLAWARAYGLSAGMLPSDTSRHLAEYVYTDARPSGEACRIVTEAHGTDDTGDRVLRASCSILAVFGALHMANNHTWKASDRVLSRKANALVNALRTVVSESVLATLQGNVETTVRTVSHPFGLSSTWAIFSAGRTHRFIAEALYARSIVVPPPVQTISLVISTVGKICALPFGGMISRLFDEPIAVLTTHLDHVQANVGAYSQLSRYYGYERTAVLDPAVTTQIEALLPMCAGYARVFERDDNGNPIGAALSQAIERIYRENSGLVQMYELAFQTFMDEGTNVRALFNVAIESQGIRRTGAGVPALMN